NLYRDPIVAQNTETCDFALKDLPGGDRPVSLYLTTPPSDITRTRPLLRLLLNQLGRRLTETLDPGIGRVGSQPRPRLLLLLHVMASEQEVRRPLLTPDEVMRLPDDTALIFVAGRAPIYGRRIRYYEDPVFAARASVPPPVGSDRLAHDWGTWPEPAGTCRA